jgi:regulator of RNase E activity RraB
MDIMRGQWNGYAYRFGQGERCIVTFDISACDPANQRPSQLRRVIGFSPENHISPEGIPSPQAFARLKQIEFALLERLDASRVAAWMIGTQVYRGYRELLFQVDDLRGFAKAYEAVEAKFGGMELIEHPDWKFFNDKIRPGVIGQNHIGNRDVITGLKQAGSDLSAEHTLEHLFLGPPAALDAVQRKLASRKFVVEGRGEGALTMTIDEPLDDQDLIDSMTMWLREVAEDAGATYDGWGAMVVRPRS